MTGLACVLRRDYEQQAARPIQFVSKLPPKLIPSLIEDRFVQPGFGTDIPARMFKAARCRTAHVLHPQVFHDNYRVVFADDCRGLVEKIASYVGNSFVQPLNLGFLSVPVCREFDLAGQFALHGRKFVLVFTKGMERGQTFAAGKRGEAGYAHVYANGALRRMNRCFNFPLCLDGHMPLPCGQGDRDLLRQACGIPAFPVSHPTYLGQIDAGIFFIQLESLRIAESIMYALLLEARQLSPLLEKVGVCPVQVFQSLLKYLRMRFGQKSGLFRLFPVTEKSGQLIVAVSLSFRFPCAFFQRKRLVPKKTTRPCESPHLGGLLRFGL